MYRHNWILREIVRSRAVPLLNSRSLFSKDTHILGDSKPLAGAYMDGWPTLIPFLFWPMSHRGHPGYCVIVSPSWSNTSISLFPCVAPEIALKYRVIFSLYLRRLPHVGGGRTTGRRWPAGSIQHNWVLQSERLAAVKVALMGWSPLMKTLLASIDRFIWDPSPFIAATSLQTLSSTVK